MLCSIQFRAGKETAREFESKAIANQVVTSLHAVVSLAYSPSPSLHHRMCMRVCVRVCVPFGYLSHTRGQRKGQQWELAVSLPEPLSSLSLSLVCRPLSPAFSTLSAGCLAPSTLAPAPRTFPKRC